MSFRWFLFIVFVACFALGARADAANCERVSIKGKFMGKSGDFFELMGDRRIFKVGPGEYHYLYAYYASGLLCDENLLLVEGEEITVKRIR